MSDNGHLLLQQRTSISRGCLLFSLLPPGALKMARFLHSHMAKGRFRMKMTQRNISEKDNFLTPIYVYIGDNENKNENNHKENIK